MCVCERGGNGCSNLFETSILFYTGAKAGQRLNVITVTVITFVVPFLPVAAASSLISNLWRSSQPFPPVSFDAFHHIHSVPASESEHEFIISILLFSPP